MLKLYIYTLERYKSKALKQSEDKLLRVESDSDFKEAFNKLEEAMCSKESYVYAMDSLEAVKVLEKLSELSSRFDSNKIVIYLDSRITFGSKWGKYTKTDIETFKIAIDFIKEGFPENETTRRKKKKGGSND